MALLGTFGALVLYLACAASTLRLQMTRFLGRSWFLTAVATVGILYSAWIFYGAGNEVNSWGVLLLAAGAILYFIMKRVYGSTPAPADDPAGPAE
jgi:hypothetical protein